MKTNWRGFLFWLSWGAIGGAWELTTWLTGHSDMTLSWQVWWLVAGQSWGWRVFDAEVFVFVALVLAGHFFGRDDG